MSDPYVTVCKGVVPGDNIVATYPNQLFLSFVSLTSDSTPFFYVNVQYANYKIQQSVNSLKCMNLSNTAQPQTTPPPPVSSNTTNTTSNQSSLEANGTYGPVNY